MANESNKKRKNGEIVCVGAGGLAASYSVSKYLARIVPVCFEVKEARLRTV